MGYDFTAGQPDLVVSVPHAIQSPEIASLGGEISLLVRVFNRGEADSAPAVVSLNYSGATLSANIGALAPGQYQEVPFSGLVTPEYLSSMPTLTVSVSNGYWHGNNSIQSAVRYPDRTPIYPPGAVLYTWTVENSVTHARLDHATVSVQVPGMMTVDGQVHTVVLVNETDASGQVKFRLPAGTYTLNLSKYGYAPGNPQITVPAGSSHSSPSNLPAI